jgi:hypothetical protein
VSPVHGDFSFAASVGPADADDFAELSFTKQPSIIEQKAYRDTWGRGLDGTFNKMVDDAALLSSWALHNRRILACTRLYLR